MIRCFFQLGQWIFGLVISLFIGVAIPGSNCFSMDVKPNTLSASTFVELPASSPEAVKWAAGKLEDLLRANRNIGKWPDGVIRVVSKAALRKTKPINSNEYEGGAFTIQQDDDKKITIIGDGYLGQMYGLLEVRERMAIWLQRVVVNKNIKETFIMDTVSKTPSISIRAQNLFIQVDQQGQLKPWFFDDRFWNELFSAMAINRFNVLDLHGAYCPSTTRFSNLWALFRSPKKQTPRAIKNSRQLEKILKWAEARGVQIGLMNYGGSVEGKDRSQRIAATTASFQGMLSMKPPFALLGSRLKRKGDRAVDWFDKVYARPWRRAGAAGKLYARSWGTNLETIKDCAERSRGNLLVLVKYNGEQLGLPYPAVQGWGEDYSYQGYLGSHKNFGVLWQVRAAGTHRIFPWGDPDFIRSAVRSFSLGHAQGFSLESPWVYSTSQVSSRYRETIVNDNNSSQIPAAGIKSRYLFERQWVWGHLWGRLSFDPDATDEELGRAFKLHHGLVLGPAVQDLMGRMSKILPLVFSSYCVGLDHRDAAPEIEFGYWFRDRKKTPRSLDLLTQIQPLDRARGCSPREFAQAIKKKSILFKASPMQIATRLDKLSDAAIKASVHLGKTLRQQPGQTSLATLALEGHCLGFLGKSSASRLRALTYYSLFLESGDARWLEPAEQAMRRALAHWKKLARIADRIYLPVQAPLRGERGFTWESKGKVFNHLIAVIEKKRTEVGIKQKGVIPSERSLNMINLEPEEFGMVAFQVKRDKPHELLLTLKFEDGKKKPDVVNVLFKPLNSEVKWIKKRMRADQGRYLIRLKEPKRGLLIQCQAAKAGRGCFLELKGQGGVPFLWTKAMESE